MKSNAFDVQYRRLNKGQKSAVDAIEGPVMVIAGPGTGKTSVLTLRIANILRKTDTPANGILALTFTESAVHSMRRKLVDLIGSDAYRVNLYTFHGFAQEIITQYPEYFPRVIGGSVVSDSDRLRILEDSLSKGNFTVLRPFGKPMLYVRKALSVIQDLKRDTVTPKDFLRLITEERVQLEKSNAPKKKTRGHSEGEFSKEYVQALRNNAKNTELAALYAAYEDSLRSEALYDFEDMLVELVHALEEHTDLLRSLQEEYLYILADEHQDANTAQNMVLELLSDYRETQNLFVVGDEKQAIYRFQGASLENFLYFQKKFPHAALIFLDENYRSTQTILDASHALMQANNTGDKKLRPRLKSLQKKHTEQPIRLFTFETEDDELDGIAADIQHSITAGIPAEEIAVLVRTNSEIAPVGRALSACLVSHTLFADDDILSDADIAKLLLLLRAVVRPHDDELVGSVLFIDFLGLHPVDAIRLNRSATEKRRSPLELLSHIKARPELYDQKSADLLARNFVIWMGFVRKQSAADAFVSIVRESKFQEHLLSANDSLSKLEKLSRLYDEIRNFLVSHKNASLEEFIESIEILKRHGSRISFKRSSVGTRGVLVMTAHKAKGLEWRRVYVLHAADRVWGNRRSVASFRLPPPMSSAGESEADEDERRLFYVALTRAKELVTLSYATRDRNGKNRLASRFVEELRKDAVSEIRGSSVEPVERITKIVEATNEDTAKKWDFDYLKEVFLDQGLNATALNNYLECPWKYFFKNLVRLPDVPSPYLSFGTAVHTALKSWTDAVRQEKKFSPTDFVSAFAYALEKLPISETDFRHALLKGKRILPVYFKDRSKSLHQKALTEYSITGVFLPLSSGVRLLLRGRLDKIELLRGSSVNVVDYKTGGYKTRNDILGKTKNSNGNIKRQLDFYRLLLNLHDKGRYEMVSADVDFVEPDARGNIRPPEHFEISAEDARAVSETVRQVAEEIISFSFWNKKCDDPECEFCKKRELLG